MADKKGTFPADTVGKNTSILGCRYEGLRGASPPRLDQYTAALNNAKQWHPEPAVFGQETYYFEMAVVHNLQALPHHASGDVRLYD
jgi:hypothetical protein